MRKVQGEGISSSTTRYPLPQTEGLGESQAAGGAIMWLPCLMSCDTSSVPGGVVAQESSAWQPVRVRPLVLGARAP